MRQEGLLGTELHAAIRDASVFIPGLGAIGSAALTVLARCGVGRFVLIDDDQLDPENVASQLFALTETIGKPKAKVAEDLVHSINPECIVERHGVTCDVSRLVRIISGVDVVVLGMDTLSGGIACYRAARLASRPVVDFLYFPIPNVLSTLPTDPTPEERFEYPTLGVPPEDCDAPRVAAESMLRVLSYCFAANPGLLQEPTIRNDSLLRRFLRLEGPIPSSAVLTTEVGALMARETLKLVARSRGIRHSPRAWPAFFIDPYRSTSAVPPDPALSRTPGAVRTMQALLEIRDRRGTR